MKHVPRWTRVASIGGAATAGLTAVWAAARYAPWDAHIVVIAAALSPMAIVPACLATALLAWARRRVATTLAALLAVAILAAQLPLAVAGSPAPGERFVVMTMNME
ncbi:MAG: hypothetical protein JWM93_1974, partial [Frankiales bacterium]|nr:hypothetical protein [Frankiales bacterium]